MQRRPIGLKAVVARLGSSHFSTATPGSQARPIAALSAPTDILTCFACNYKCLILTLAFIKEVTARHRAATLEVGKAADEANTVVDEVEEAIWE